MTSAETASVVRSRFDLGAQWPTLDPFLFVAHHRDAYPAGNEDLGPRSELTGRQIGMDFADVDGWNMYHGSTVPGFPQHPHRGFETITYVRTGIIDHSDSLGATARFGRGDTQWMTAGAGIVHAEMFPLLDPEGPNALELFQIWLNLPAADKMVDPYFTMHWSEQTPRVVIGDGSARAEVTVVAGSFDPGQTPPQPPPPNSWAARPEADVAIWHISLGAEGLVMLPPSTVTEVNRALYVFDGATAQITAVNDDETTEVDAGSGVEVDASRGLELRAIGGGVEILVMQGRPMGEPVVQYGPFVMNDREGILKTLEDYQTTGFGGWPWPSDDPVQNADAGRFALHADGRSEQP